MSVDPVPNRNAVGAGLDMDVRRFLLYRVGDDLVDEADERRIIGDVA